MADPFVAEIRIFPFNFAPRELGMVRRAVAAAIAEYSFVLAAGHHLWWRREVEFRAS